MKKNLWNPTKTHCAINVFAFILFFQKPKLWIRGSHHHHHQYPQPGCAPMDAPFPQYSDCVSFEASRLPSLPIESQLVRLSPVSEDAMRVLSSDIGSLMCLVIGYGIQEFPSHKLGFEVYFTTFSPMMKTQLPRTHLPARHIRKYRKTISGATASICFTWTA